MTARAPTEPLPPDDDRAPPRSASRLPAALRSVRAAVVLFTRVPVGGFPYRPEDWAWAAAHGPLVGLLVGGFSGGLFRLLLPVGPLPSAFLVLGASLLITGAMHEDGLADTSDALGGAHDTSRVLAILKDSRIGVFGGAALCVSIGVRAALMARLGAANLWALPIVGCAARVGPVWLMARLPYVTALAEAKSAAVARARLTQALVATAWLGASAALAIALGCATAGRLAVLVLAMALTTLVTGWRYRRRAGGITGDFLGATEQLGEIAALAVLAWSSG